MMRRERGLMMQARRDKHPLYSEARMRLYAFAFMALHTSGERALGASYVSSDQQEVAERYALDHALKELPKREGFRDHFVTVCLIDDRNIEAIVQGW
jgi:hypothetical protein